jgi:hypothetical protein
MFKPPYEGRLVYAAVFVKKRGGVKINGPGCVDRVALK